MSERLYLFFVGIYILISLYLEVEIMIYVLCLLLFIEGITNLRLTTLSQKLMHVTLPSGLVAFKTHQRFKFDAIRAWRLTVAVMLAGSLFLLNEYDLDVVWFFPWFMGFAIMGAGASSVCPVLLFIRWIGFK